MITAQEVRALTRAVGEQLSTWRAAILAHVDASTKGLASIEYVDNAQREAVLEARDLAEDRFDVRLADFPTTDETSALIETAIVGERERTSDVIRAEVSDAVSEAVAPLAGTIAETLRASPELRGEPGSQGRDGADGLGLDAPSWASGVYREGSVVSHYFGQVFRAVRDTSDEPGESDDWSRLGTCGFRMAEPFRDGNVYRAGDLFVRDRSLFMMTDNGPRLAVGRGAPGAKGERGERGQDGAEIELIELRGLELAVVYRSGTETRGTRVDLSPLVDTIARRVLSQLAREATP